MRCGPFRCAVLWDEPSSGTLNRTGAREAEPVEVGALEQRGLVVYATSDEEAANGNDGEPRYQGRLRGDEVRAGREHVIDEGNAPRLGRRERFVQSEVRDELRDGG